METKLVLSDLMVDMLKQVSTEDRGKREMETQKGIIQKVFCIIFPYKLVKIHLAFLSHHSASKGSFVFFLNEKEKRRPCPKIFDVTAVRTSKLVNRVFYRQTGFSSAGIVF